MSFGPGGGWGGGGGSADDDWTAPLWGPPGSGAFITPGPAWPYEGIKKVKKVGILAVLAIVAVLALSRTD
ncbi:hypothetical protein ES703_124240 [subsurface metagenome]